jgi:hypothetical protein
VLCTFFSSKTPLAFFSSCSGGVAAAAAAGLAPVACGLWHTAAVSDSGDLYAWGWGRHGQLGPPTGDGKGDDDGDGGDGDGNGGADESAAAAGADFHALGDSAHDGPHAGVGGGNWEILVSASPTPSPSINNAPSPLQLQAPATK